MKLKILTFPSIEYTLYPPGRLWENYEKIIIIEIKKICALFVFAGVSTLTFGFRLRCLPASPTEKRHRRTTKQSGRESSRGGAALIPRTREYPPLRRSLLTACRTRTVNNYRYRYRNERNWLLRQFQFAEQSEAKWRRTKPREAGKKRLSRWKEIFMSAGSTAFVAVTAGPWDSATVPGNALLLPSRKQGSRSVDGSSREENGRKLISPLFSIYEDFPAARVYERPSLLSPLKYPSNPFVRIGFSRHSGTTE